MTDDEIAGPSLLLARHNKAHREHSQQIQHQHHRLHKKQDVTEVVTEVVATISVLQKIDVDLNGHTITIQTILADSTDSTSYASSPGVLTSASSPSVSSASPSSPSSTSDTASPSIISSSSQASSIVADTSSLLSALDVPSVQTFTPSISTSFPSLSVSVNSTKLISSSSSFIQTFSNSSISSTTSSSRSSFPYLGSTSSSSSRGSPTISTSSLYSPITSSYLATGTDDVGGILGAGTGVAGGPESTSSSSSAAGGSDSDTGTTPTPVVIGGVVGSLAGVAIIALALLYLYRWKKRGQMLSLGSGDGGADTIHGGPKTQPPGGMTEQRSIAFVVPAALASLTGYKRYSQKTDKTISSTAGSERGFYRVSGRKLPSVLQTGGDGYGGGIPDENTLSGSSFYRDSHGLYGGPGGPSSPPVGISMQRDSGIPVMRPSPARTPVTEHGPFGFGSSPDFNTPPRRPDTLGRSHPSQDGSHASKFTEEV